MELTNEFRVPVPVTEAWALLTDVERIAPCMPGAELQEIEGDEYRGIVKVKVGPITAQYKGKASFVERDEAAGKAVLRAEGRDTRGQGNANATITAQLVPDGEGTQVTVTTDLTVTGRVAQFGRGVMADVSSKLLGQFVDCLESKVLAGGGTGPAADEAPAPAESASMAAGPTAAAAPASESSAEAQGAGVAVEVDDSASSNGTSASSAAASASAATGSATEGVRRIQSAPAEPVDLLDAAGAPVVKRALPVAIGAFVVLLLLRRRRRRHRRG